MRNIESVDELKKICWRSSPDWRRRLSIYVVWLFLKFGLGALYVTLLRTTFLFIGFFCFTNYANTSHYYNIFLGLLCYQTALFLDTMDGALARYNKTQNWIGEFADFALDHFSSSFVYFFSLSIIFMKNGEDFFALLSVFLVFLAQFAFFWRATITRKLESVEFLKKSNFWLKLFHQDNMRGLLLSFCIFAVLSLNGLSFLKLLSLGLLLFLVAKILYLFYRSVLL